MYILDRMRGCSEIVNFNTPAVVEKVTPRKPIGSLGTDSTLVQRLPHAAPTLSQCSVSDDDVNSVSEQGLCIFNFQVVCCCALRRSSLDKVGL